MFHAYTEQSCFSFALAHSTAFDAVDLTSSRRYAEIIDFRAYGLRQWCSLTFVRNHRLALRRKAHDDVLIISRAFDFVADATLAYPSGRSARPRCRHAARGRSI
jgi:hypothetical protein